MKFGQATAAAVLIAGIATTAQATVTAITPCTGANACTITTSPPNPVTQNPNDGILLLWDEVQNFTLTTALRVDRVFDTNASFVTAVSGGDYELAAGTIVSSHYVPWDPGNGSASTVNATIRADSQIFAFITSDANLASSDPFLGLPGINYNTFGLRGLEVGDTTVFNGADVDISWSAGSPGDWTRLITAYSPTAAVPVPASGIAMLALVPMAAWMVRRRGQLSNKTAS